MIIKVKKKSPDVLGIRGMNDKEPIDFSKFAQNSWNVLKGIPPLKLRLTKNYYLVIARTDQIDPSKFFYFGRI
ncbi:MAG: hypothetical protein QXU18_10655 [Thermoplasmatales archaeon]